MALTKATYGMISADTSTIDLNIDANTLYVDSSANKIGIGTNSPDAKLRIDQDANELALKVTGGGSGVHIAQFIRDVGATASVNIGASAGEPQISFVDANTFSIGVNSTYFEIAANANIGTNTRFVIDQAGNVDIGTGTLTVAQNILSTSGAPLVLSAAGGGSNIELYTNGTAFIDATSTSFRGTNGSGTGNISAGTISGTLSYVGSGSFPVTPNTSGDDLVIFGTGSHGISILSGTSGDGNIFFGDSGGNVRAKIQYSHNGDYMTIMSPGAYNVLAGGDMTVDAAGDIILDAGGGDWKFKDDGTEIGLIANSSSDLIIQSTVSDKDMIFRGNDGGSTIVALTLDMSDAGTAHFENNVYINSSLYVGDDVRLSSDSNGELGVGYGQTATNNRFTVYNNTTPALRVLPNGNVGIGTTAPAKTLDVAANGASQGIHLNISGVGRLQMYADGDRNYFKALSGNGHRFTTTGGANVEILNNGNVGIGTTAPSYTLTVQKDVDDYIAKLENDGNSTSSNGLWVDTRWNTATNTLFRVTTNSGTSEAFNIKGNGMVGIHEVSPLSMLHIGAVNGIGNADIRLDNNTVNSSHFGLKWYDGTTQKAEITWGESNANLKIRNYRADASGNYGRIDFDVGSTSNPPTRMVIQGATGRVGIGTTDPVSDLEIYGSAPILTIRDGGTHGSNSTPYIELRDNTSGQAYMGVTDTSGVLAVWNLKPQHTRLGAGNVERFAVDGTYGHITLGPRDATSSTDSASKGGKISGMRSVNVLDWMERRERTDKQHGDTAGSTNLYGVAFGLNGAASRNKWYLGEGPSGSLEWLWQGISNGGTGATGGWNTNTFYVDNNYSYIVINWVKRVSSANTGTYYHGTGGVHDSSGNSLGNPYMTIASSGTLPLNVWCVDIQPLHAFHMTSNTEMGQQGLFRTDTGARLQTHSGQFSGVNAFRLGTSANQSHGITHRSYLYYATDNDGTELHWACPAIYRVDGTQPRVSELIKGFGAAAAI